VLVRAASGTAGRRWAPAVVVGERESQVAGCPRLRPRTVKQRGAGFKSPVRLPRALRALAYEPTGHRRRASPSSQGGPNGATGTRVILDGRATSVPFTTVTTGPERTTTDNTMAAATCAASPPSQVTVPPDLALGAGGRWSKPASALPCPAGRSGPWPQRTGAPHPDAHEIAHGTRRSGPG
jgi:hypothetical protein